MNSINLRIPAAAFLLGISAAAANELPAPRKCDVQEFKLEEHDKVNYQKIISILDLVTQDNFAQMQRNLSSSWDGEYGFFKTNYNDLDVKRSNFKTQHNYNYDMKFSRDYAISTLSEEGLQAYQSCLDHEFGSFSVVASLVKNTPSDKLVTLQVYTKNTLMLNDFSVTVYGGDLAAADTPLFRRQQNINAIERDQANRAVLIVFNSGVRQSNPLTFRRTSISEEFRAVPSFGGLDTKTLEIPRQLQTREESEVMPILVSGVVQLEKPSDHGGDFHHRSFRATASGQEDYEEPNAWTAANSAYATLLCACASRAYARTPYPTRCSAPSSVPPPVLRNVSPDVRTTGCNIAPIEPAANNPNEVCFSQKIYMNNMGNGTTCSVSWSLNGETVTKKTVFVDQP
jgi:hypothetical protein